MKKIYIFNHYLLKYNINHIIYKKWGVLIKKYKKYQK